MYILNRLLTLALSGQMPYEAWTGRKLNVGHTIVFQCVVHMKIPVVQVKQLDCKSKQMVNVENDPRTKAYRFYDPVTDRVYVSRDVTFKENKS